MNPLDIAVAEAIIGAALLAEYLRLRWRHHQARKTLNRVVRERDAARWKLQYPVEP